MKKRNAFVWAGVSVVLLGAAFACEDSAPDSRFAPGAPDADTDTGPGFNLDGGVDPGPIVCNPALPTQFKPTWVPPTKMDGACTNDQLGEYFDNCLADLNDPDGKCAAWLEANEQCASCVHREDGSGPILLFNFGEERPSYRLNQGGCIALVTEAMGEEDCGAAFSAATECRRASCDDCIAKGGAFGKGPSECSDDKDPTTYICCEQKAARTGCDSYEKKQDQVCQNYQSPDGGAPQCFKSSSTEDNRSLYVRVEGLFCGN